MPIAIKKEMVFGLLIILLIILVVLNMTKKGNTGSNFGDLLGENGIQILSDPDRNAIDSSIAYTLPGEITIGTSVASYYKWPLLYLIDASNVTSVSASSLSADSAYKKPPPKALINNSYVSYGAAGTTYYAPSTIADGNFFPNLINLTNLYGNNPDHNLQLPSSGGFTVGENNTVAPSASGTWVIPGLSAVINTPLVSGKTYILGISAQLTNPYVNLYGTSKYVGADPVNKRFGNFIYVNASYSVSGLTVTVPLSPSGATASTLTLTI